MTERISKCLPGHYLGLRFEEVGKKKSPDRGPKTDEDTRLG